MYDELLTYYEQELNFIRKMAQGFARDYPRIAGRLLLEDDKCDDPHVERLIQGFAFLAARIHRKIDEEFPEIAEALLNVLYPHYLAPIPAMAIAQFVPDPNQGQLTGGYTIKRHTTLHSQPVNGTSCRFRTCYPVTLWPVEVVSARFDAANSVSNWPEKAAGVIRIKLRCQGGATFSDLEMERFRFFLNGESKLVHALYELIFNNVVSVRLQDGDPKNQRTMVELPSNCLRPVGFEKDEGMLPYPSHAFIGYRLLHEYFTFPAKFLFVDVGGLKRALHTGFKDELEILIFVDQSGPSVGAENFLLGCTPIINLFNQIAEPISVDGTRSEYRIIPDLRRQRAMEIYSVDKVTSTSPFREEPIDFQPLYSFKHTFNGERTKAFWHARRKPSASKDDTGTEIYLSLVDLGFDPAQPGVEVLTVHTTCANRDLPAQLRFEDGHRHFDVEEKAPLANIRCVTKPAPTIRPPMRGEALWRLISHLSLNYLSLTDKEDGRKALQEILKLYDFAGSLATQQQIEGIIGVESRRTVKRISDTNGGAFARGIEVTIALDDDKFVGSSKFLLASVLERFLGLYVSINSFCQLIVNTKDRIKQGKGPLKKWPPRAGEQTLL
jgi:type VI secretion system protein ImpG